MGCGKGAGYSRLTRAGIGSTMLAYREQVKEIVEKLTLKVLKEA